MRGRTKRAAVPILLASLAAVQVLAASQQAPAETRPISVIVGFDTNVPGRPISIPLLLDVPENARIGSIELEIRFPVHSLEYQQTRRGSAAESVGAALTASAATDPSDPDSAILKVAITAPAGTWLRSGIAANLDFKIADKAAVGESVRLRNTARAMSADTPPQPLNSVESEDGEVQVAAEPPVLTSCFFYMH